MGQINYQLDLNEKYLRSRHKRLRSRLTLLTFYLLLAGLLILLCAFLDRYMVKLQAETELLKLELATKTEAAAPLIAMADELDTCALKAEIVENLLSGYLIKTDNLKAIRTSALPSLQINYLAIDAEGKVTLRGSCADLQAAALYAGKLQDLPFIEKAELTAADQNEEQSCCFSISADLKHAVGGCCD